MMRPESTGRTRKIASCFRGGEKRRSFHSENLFSFFCLLLLHSQEKRGDAMRWRDFLYKIFSLEIFLLSRLSVGEAKGKAKTPSTTTCQLELTLEFFLVKNRSVVEFFTSSGKLPPLVELQALEKLNYVVSFTSFIFRTFFLAVCHAILISNFSIFPDTEFLFHWFSLDFSFTEFSTKFSSNFFSSKRYDYFRPMDFSLGSGAWLFGFLSLSELDIHW